ncbi:diguanylate cyclase [Metabacillus halosaccharovorans]|uniref:GGDEF domain-containing protein n=1 Tax=Metabacillus halosaccharovorans TaxID=930124 RepID=UPI003CCBBAEE
MVLWLSSLLYLWSINTSRLFTLTPIAKTTIFNSINDGVIVLDEFYRLIEFNQSCKSMFPNINTSMLGTGFEKVWLQLSGSPFPTKIERTSTFTKEIHLASDRIYQVRSSSLQHAKYEKGLLIIFTDITELKRLQVKLEQLAYYDELTQIYNRRAFFQKSEQEFAEAKKRSIPFTMILIDIDYFKKVNDTYGHHIGDQLLKHVVKACQTQLNEGELFARYGGEEFVLALKGCTAIEGEEIANKLRRYVETQPLRSDKGDIYVTLSLGVAEASEERDETLYQLLNHSDNALYRAKGEGRNQVNVFNGEKGEMIKAP